MSGESIKLMPGVLWVVRVAKMSVVHVLIFHLSMLALVAASTGETRLMPDALLDTVELARKYGYQAEVHTVETADGYILEMHRIPHGAQSAGEAGKPVVFLQHGMFSSSADWVVMGPQQGFAYLLADLGYDVWMGNSRGNTYSRKHVTMDPDDVNGTFWDFTWHEMGVHDLPACLDYVLATTGQQQVFYAGHSQGTTQFYVLASVLPEYNAKIRAMFSLSAIAYNSPENSTLIDYLSGLGTLQDLEDWMGIHETLPHSQKMVILADQLCSDGAVTQGLCESVLFLIAGGPDEEQLNSTMLPVILAHTPAGSSTKQSLHYTQGTFSGHFRQYDFGVDANMELYGTAEPPDYDLAKITCPVAIHVGLNDLPSEENIDRLIAALGNPLGKFVVPHAAWNHIDFLWAIDAKVLLYDTITTLMSTFLEKSRDT